MQMPIKPWVAVCGADGGQDTDPNGPWVQGLPRWTALADYPTGLLKWITPQ